MATNKTIKIPGPLECIIYDGYVTTSDQVFDETTQKTQDEINEQTADIDGRLSIVEQHDTISMDGGSVVVGTSSDMESSETTSRSKIPTVGAIQDSLKTINNMSIIGEGNISIESGEDNVIEVVEVNGTALEVTDKTVNIDLSGYQTALSSQTAYTEKGSSTKVPKITTNALGQVTAIEEVAISGGGGGGEENVIDSITFNGDSVPVDENKNAAITYTAPVTSVNGSTGDVTISIPTASSFDIKDLADSTSLRSTWSGKQDALVFNTAYNASSNKVATMSDVPSVSLSNGTITIGSSSITPIQKSQSATGLLKDDGTVDTTAYGTYSKPSGGIPASDLASGVIPDVSTKIDKVTSATATHLASFVSGGGLQDSGYKIVTISDSDYEELGTKDANTIYLVTSST